MPKVTWQWNKKNTGVRCQHWHRTLFFGLIFKGVIYFALINEAMCVIMVAQGK